jgi:uncharacterized protein (DUF1778 family)
MSASAPNAEVNIHLRARARDRDLIDQAAEASGSNRSQFMLSSAVKEAKNILLDQTTIQVDATRFQEILAALDAEPAADQVAGLSRLLASKVDWAPE